MPSLKLKEKNAKQKKHQKKSSRIPHVLKRVCRCIRCNMSVILPYGDVSDIFHVAYDGDHTCWQCIREYYDDFYDD